MLFFYILNRLLFKLIVNVIKTLYTNQAQVQTLADQLEFIVQEKMLSHNQTLLKVDKSSNHFGVAVNG